MPRENIRMPLCVRQKVIHRTKLCASNATFTSSKSRLNKFCPCFWRLQSSGSPAMHPRALISKRGRREDGIRNGNYEHDEVTAIVTSSIKKSYGYARTCTQPYDLP